MKKDDYRKAVKAARNQLRADYRTYRAEVRKQRLLWKQAKLKAQLREMGVWSKQIPVTVVETKPQKIKVRVG